MKTAFTFAGIVVLRTVPALAATHPISIVNTGGGALQVFNAEGPAANPPTFTQVEIDAAQVAADLAGWSVADKDALHDLMVSNQADKCYTACFRADRSFAKCDGECQDCEVITVHGNSGRSAAVDLQTK